MESNFLLLGAALITATIAGFISKKFKQPLVLAYILTGFIFGPAVLGIVTDLEHAKLLSQIGIAFLLFTVGLHLNLQNLKELGRVSIITGLAQVVITTIAGYLLSLKLGFSSIASIYIGVGLAFSSTIIIVKMLGEKGDMNSLHGRISVGFLLVQDFIAILALVMISGLSSGQAALPGFLLTLMKALLFLFIVAIATKYLVPTVFHSVAKNQELLFLSGISYCFLLGMFSHFLGLSIEIGSFVAGVSLATLPYNLHIESKIRPLRDFFIVIFFMVLGAEMSLSLTPETVLPLVLLSVLVLIGNPIILLIIMGLMGYRKRTSFLVSVTVAQISEFSMILAALGARVGHLSQEVVSLITGVGVITITVSAYLIMYSHKIYYRIEKYLSIFERDNPARENNIIKTDFKDHIVVVGYHRVGFGIVNKLKSMKKEFLVVDFDPELIKQMTKEGIPCVYGDIADPELLESIHLDKAEMVISTAPDIEDNLNLMITTKEMNPAAIVIIVAEDVEEALELYEKGADYVVLPHLLGGDHASLLLEDISTNIDKLIETKINHIEELRERKNLHPYHPSLSKHVDRK